MTSLPVQICLRTCSYWSRLMTQNSQGAWRTASLFRLQKCHKSVSRYPPARKPRTGLNVSKKQSVSRERYTVSIYAERSERTLFCSPTWRQNQRFINPTLTITRTIIRNVVSQLACRPDDRTSHTGWPKKLEHFRVY